MRLVAVAGIDRIVARDDVAFQRATSRHSTGRLESCRCRFRGDRVIAADNVGVVPEVYASC
jgi:hypothetical protein